MRNRPCNIACGVPPCIHWRRRSPLSADVQQGKHRTRTTATGKPDPEFTSCGVHMFKLRPARRISFLPTSSVRRRGRTILRLGSRRVEHSIQQLDGESEIKLGRKRRHGGYALLRTPRTEVRCSVGPCVLVDRLGTPKPQVTNTVEDAS